MIYIGLGGTGLKILNKVKNRFSSEAADVQFLGIDVGSQERGGLEPNEFVDLAQVSGGGGINVKKIVNDPNYWNLIESWWPDKEYKPDITLNKGANHRRFFARLALFYAGSLIIKSLTDKIKNVRGTEGNVSAVVVASSGGGCGSSLFVDIPGFVKSAGISNVYGVLINNEILNNYISRDPNEREHNDFNTYATFRELAIVQNFEDRFRFVLSDGNEIKLYPYKLIFLMSLKNRSGYSLDALDDYLDTTTSFLYNLKLSDDCDSLNTTDGKKFSGLENIVSDTITARKLYPVVNHPEAGKQKINIPLALPMNVGSFAVFEVYFPEDEVIMELKHQVLRAEVSKIKNIREGKREEMDNLVKTLMMPIRESNSSDKLFSIVEDFIIKKGKKFSDRNIEDNVKSYVLNNIKNINKIRGYVENIKDGIKEALSSVKEEVENGLNKEKNKFLEQIKTNVMNNHDYNLGEKLKILDDLIEEIRTEKEDVEDHEKEKLLKKDMKAVENEIKNVFNNFQNQKKNINVLKRIFQTGYINSLYKGFAGSISSKIVEYKKTVKIENFVGNVLSFYQELINTLTGYKNEINRVLKELEDIIAVPPNTRIGRMQPVVGALNWNDTRLRVFNDRNALKYYWDEKIKDFDFTVPEELNSIKEHLVNKVDEYVREKLQGFSLDKALKLEAAYFYRGMEFSLKSSQQARRFKGFLNVCNESTQHEWESFLEKWKNYFDPSYLTELRSNILRRGKDVKDRYLEEDINKLVKARLRLIWFYWSEPFSDSFINVSYIPKNEKDYSIIFVDNNSNPVVSEFLKDVTTSVVSQTGVMQETPEGFSRCKVEFVRFSMNCSFVNFASVSTTLKDKEQTTNDSILSLLTSKFMDVDANKIYFRDKAFFSVPEFSFYILLPKAFSNEQIDTILMTEVLFLLLGYFSEQNGKLVSQKEKWYNNRGILLEGLEFDNIYTFFNYLLFLGDAGIDLEGLLRELCDEFRAGTFEESDLKNKIDEFFSKDSDRFFYSLKGYITKKMASTIKG